MADRLLLDTCATLWLMEGADLSPAALSAIDAVTASGVDCYVSPITAWEVGLLAARGRYLFTMSPARWFARLTALAGIALAELSPEVLIASSFLPGEPPGDPADRMIIATAREHALTIVTRDRRILAYAEAGHVAALPC